MVRDHKYSRFSGFKNNIPPILLRHPVNCQLITGAKNVSKIHKDIGYGVGNSIGLKQLFSGIKGYKKEWGEQKKCLITIATYGVII